MASFSFPRLASLTPRLAIDLGSSRTRIWQVGKGKVLDEPTCLAYDENARRIVAVGEEALQMMGRAKSSIVIRFPIQHGVFQNPDDVQQLLKIFIQRVFKSSVFWRPEVVVSVPTSATELERQAFVQLLTQAGLGNVSVVSQLLAAEIGAGVPIADVSGSVMFLLGGGLAEVGVISLGSVVRSNSRTFAGVNVVLKIQQAIQESCSLHVSYRGAQDILHKVASFNETPHLTLTICGQDVMTKVPRERTMSQQMILPVLLPLLDQYTRMFQQLLEDIPAELSSDIVDKGVLLGGGLSQIDGFEQSLVQRLGIPVSLIDDPSEAVIKGLAQIAEHIDDFRESIGYE
jgi:rod shape-determining protein MreB